MQPKPALSVVVLAALAALVIWLLAGGDPATSSGGTAAGPAAPGAPAPETVPAVGVEGAAPASRRPVEPEDATAGRGTDAGSAMNVVRGRLVDGSSQPVPGVTVVLSSFRAAGAPGGMGLPDLGNPARGRQQKESGPDGRFEFAVATDRGGVISADDGERVLRSGPVTFQPSSAPVDLGDLQVLSAAVLSGVVKDAAGRALPGVKVGAYPGGALMMGGGSSSGTSGDDGTFQLGRVRPGRVTLRTASPHHLPGVLELEVGDGERRSGLVLVLNEGNAISGQVVDDLGVPVAGIKVGATRREERPGMSVQRIGDDEATETDAAGWFTLAGLTGESAQVRAWGKGYAPVTESSVPTGTSNLLLRVQRVGSLEGVLRDRAGNPIAGSRVTAVRSGADNTGPFGGPAFDAMHLGSLMGEAREMAQTAADGSFRLENVSPGAVDVRARGKGHRPVEQAGVVVRPAETTSGIVLAADVGAVVRATVTDAEGRPVASATVRVSEPPPPQESAGSPRMRRFEVEDRGDGPVAFDSRGARRLGEAPTDAEGVVEIAGLPPGAALVEASHEDWAESRPVPLTLPAAGKVETRLQLLRGGFAELSVVGADREPVPGARLVVRGPLGDPSERDRGTEADGTGRVRLGPLPAGNYFAELTMEPPGRRLGDALFIAGDGPRRLSGSRVSFVLAEGTTAQVELVRPVLTRLHGVVAGADGPASGVEIELEPVREGPPEDGPARSARSDADGTWAIEDLDAGRYRLRYGKPGQVVMADEEVEIPAGTPELERNLRLRYGKLRVMVRGKADKQPVEGAEVMLLRGAAAGQPRPRERRTMMVTLRMDSGGGSEATTMTTGDRRVKTDVDGIAEIDEVPAGTWLVRITGDRHAASELPNQAVVEGALTDCGTVELDQAGRLAGRVLDADGRPAQLAMVRYRMAGSAEEQAEPAISGTFNLRGLRPGKYRLQAQALGGPSPGPLGHEVEAEVVAGRTGNVDLHLPR